MLCVSSLTYLSSLTVVARFFADRDIAIKKVEYSWGATEVKASLPGE